MFNILDEFKNEIIRDYDKRHPFINENPKLIDKLANSEYADVPLNQIPKMVIEFARMTS